MLEPHQPAPDFRSPNQHHQPVALADFRGRKRVVLYFYPKDGTPGCTIQANQFTELAAEFARHDAVVIGVSRDSGASHQAFIDKYGLRLDLLADTGGELCERYGVWQAKERNGAKHGYRALDLPDRQARRPAGSALPRQRRRPRAADARAGEAARVSPPPGSRRGRVLTIPDCSPRRVARRAQAAYISLKESRASVDVRVNDRTRRRA